MESDILSDGFDRLGLAPAVLSAVTELGYESPTPVQRECIPQLMSRRDMLGQAQTGTGKTAAFALPLLSNIDLSRPVPQALVLTPTRELALQVSEAMHSYARHLPGFHVLPVYGGQGMDLQLRQLKRGVHVVVGTPGRVMDHLRRGTLTLDELQILVLDEADEMLRMGFIEDIEWIFEQTPENRQVALFSATMAKPILQVARRHLRDPVEIKIAAKTETVAAIQQRHCLVTPQHKMDTLTRVLEVEPFDGMLIFVRTKNATEEIAEKLASHGFAAEALNGDMNQQARERVVNRLKEGRIDIVVATDIAARGLDVERISLVVNYDIPTDPASYVHRIGRTGRAGREGKALLFVTYRERRLLSTIEKVTRQQIPAIEAPSAAALSEHRIDRFTDKLRDTLAERDLDYYYGVVHRMMHHLEVSPTDIAAALTYLGQGERPFIVEELEQSQRRERRDRPHEERRERSERGKPRDSRERKPRDSAERKPRDPSERKRRQEGDDDISYRRYRLDVGHEHGATPREIVGAIANEAGIEGRYIGYIDIHDDYSTINLPAGMPDDIYRDLQKTRVRNRPLNIRLIDDGEAASSTPRPAKAKSIKRTDGNKPLKDKKKHNDRKNKDKGKRRKPSST